MDKTPNNTFRHDQAMLSGVLLANLGTPDAPETGPVKRYLAEFLSDRRVVEIPPIAWLNVPQGYSLCWQIPMYGIIPLS